MKEGLGSPLLSASARWLKIAYMYDSKVNSRVVTALLLKLTGWQERGQTLVMLDRHFQVRQNTSCFKRLAVEE